MIVHSREELDKNNRFIYFECDYIEEKLLDSFLREKIKIPPSPKHLPVRLTEKFEAPLGNLSKNMILHYRGKIDENFRQEENLYPITERFSFTYFKINNWSKEKSKLYETYCLANELADTVNAEKLKELFENWD